MRFSFLKNLFEIFLHRRHIGRHFRRFRLLDVVTSHSPTKVISTQVSTHLIKNAKNNISDLLEKLGTSADGLTSTQAEQVRLQVGINEVDHEKPLPWWLHLWHCYSNPFNLLLTFLAFFSYLTEDIRAVFVIASMVVLSTSLRFWQETKSNKAADALKAMVSNTVSVLRPAGQGIEGDNKSSIKTEEVPIKQIVPGDVIVLSAGDMIPADCRLLSAKDLFVAQAAMTGESMPVEKFVHLKDPQYSHLQALELDNILLMGTNVVSGVATAVVFSTGNHTYFGALTSSISNTERVTTAFQMGVNKVSWLLIRFMLVMVPLVLFINGFTKGNWLEAFLFALSVAVGLTPEMLPMIVTSTLAKGAVFLSRKKVIVKRLDAIQNFGGMDVLCTDKTGTLTQDKIFLSRHVDVWGGESDDVLDMAYLNSYYQTGLKNLLDVAVLEHTELYRELNLAKNFRKVDEIPFDFNRRRMSVVVAEHGNHHLLICKGAVEEILNSCSRVRHGEVDETLTPALLTKIREVTANLNEEGLRVVAVAVKELPISQDTFGVADEVGLSLLGYVAFLDPPKESTAPALKALYEHGVTVKVLTGDNELVTSKICREVGFDISGILLGYQMEEMSDEKLREQVEKINVFAKLTPLHKERIVRALKQNDHVVGFMGDGINDAPALRAADIGISVDSGTDIAKEAADIILLERSLMILEEGVLEGRRTFANMLKYIKMTASSNFGNVFSVMIASAFLPFLPMLPMHLLIQNLLYDISQIAIPFDRVDDEMIKQPLKWNPSEIGRFMMFFGPLSSVFDVLTYLLMWFVFSANSVLNQTLFQSGWFVEGLLTQTLIVHMIRTSKIPFIQSRAAPALLWMTAAVMGVGIFLPMGPFAHYFKLQALPPLYFVFLVVILLGYMCLVQFTKRIYTAKWGWC